MGEFIHSEYPIRISAIIAASIMRDADVYRLASRMISLTFCMSINGARRRFFARRLSIVVVVVVVALAKKARVPSRGTHDP